MTEFMTEKTKWIGTVTDLLSEMNCEDICPTIAAKLLHKYGKTVLKRNGVTVKFMRTNRRRLIELHRKGDGKNDRICFVPKMVKEKENLCIPSQATPLDIHGRACQVNSPETP